MTLVRTFFFAIAAFFCTLASADGVKKLTCVGYASIDNIGVIHLNLFSSESTHGGAMLLLDKKHPLYEEMRKHIGKVKAGSWKCLKSMPELKSADEPQEKSGAIDPRR